MILRVIDKQTQLFMRDDFTFDEKTEIGLDTEPSQGLCAPKWDGTQWIEVGQAPDPVETEPQAPTMEQMAIALVQTQSQLEDAQEALDFLIMGGM